MLPGDCGSGSQAVKACRLGLGCVGPVLAVILSKAPEEILTEITFLRMPQKPVAGLFDESPDTGSVDAPLSAQAGCVRIINMRSVKTARG